MAFVLDDAAVATAAEIGKEVVVEVGKEASSALESSCIEGSLSEESISKEFSINAFQPQEECIESYETSVEDEISSLKEEFSPQKFSEESIAEDEIASPVEEIERTSTFEEQTVDNFELEERRSELQDKFNLGQPHDADILRANMEIAMESQTDKSVSRAHHIVGNETPNAAKKLEEFGIDRNDPANGILLPNDASSPLKGSIHSGRHLQDYYNTVEQRLAQASSREEVLEALQSLKEDLYSGELPLQRDIQPNK